MLHRKLQPKDDKCFLTFIQVVDGRISMLQLMGIPTLQTMGISDLNKRELTPPCGGDTTSAQCIGKIWVVSLVVSCT
ncbi:hypothetical protein, partial [Paenibacillus germinis]|uniref:hypothetical protein n=1 Tax=Paenibacillus germinis TaxID=2654979 RepID=UPI001C10C12C